MPLSETSSLEDSLARILGAPATTATPAAPAASGVNYSTLMPQAGSTSVALSAEQPVIAEPPVTAELLPATTPIATTTPEVETPTGAAATTEPEQKRVSYTEFYRGRPEEEAAMKKLGYGFYDDTRTDLGANSNWVNGNPYQYRNEYNAYLGTLAPNAPMAMNEEVDIARAASRAAPAPSSSSSVSSSPLKNPGPKAPWQQSAQYWKDLAAYNATGAK